MAIEIIRATEYWQRAGAAYVRIHGMAQQCSLTLREEFDEIDNDPATKYILLMDGYLPVATCRFTTENGEAHLGRVVVVPERQGEGLGAITIREAEQWARELGCNRVSLEARDIAVGFYEKLGYTADEDRISYRTFRCIHMERSIAE